MRAKYVLASFLALAFLPGTADAQRRRDPHRDRDRDRDRERVRVRVYRERASDRHMIPSRNLSLMVGALDYDYADDQFPMAALRGDWRLTRFLRGEMGVSYALGDVPAGDAAGSTRNTSLATATIGIQAELPIPFVRPYVGAAAGLFGRFDEGGDDAGGSSFVRPTTAFPVGVRIPVSSRLALRAEARFRYDQHENNTTAANVEKTAGLSFSF